MKNHSFTHEGPLKWMCPSVLDTFRVSGEDGMCRQAFTRESSSERHAKGCKFCKKKNWDKKEIPTILLSKGPGTKLVNIVWI